MDEEKIAINTDSMSSLMAIQSKMDSEIVSEIRSLVKKSNKQIQLAWVKAHAGETYNEIVDTYAKKATSNEEVEIKTKIPISYIKKQIKREINKIWQDQWDNSTTGRKTYELIREVSTARIISDFHVNMVITGHGIFPTFQAQRFGADPYCWCEEEGTMNHILHECTLGAEIREKYFPYNHKDVQLKHLLNSDKSREGIKQLIQLYTRLALERGLQ